MTSLAKQLQKLAIPGQPSLRQVASKKRPSLLFDSEAAGDIDIDTVYSLGVNGLEELISIDQSFEEFESTLFQESCKDFERTVQTRKVLENIDSKIATFLRKLSPYFLLKPAQKCLEWLIRIFRINSFNVDSLMECVLPYHETNLFARVVQLLPVKDPSSPWHWLRPIQKAGSPLSKQTLIQHCVSVPPFLTFVCDMVSSCLKANRQSPASSSRAVLAFYSSTVIGVLEETGSITEELVSRLLPYLVKGLKSSSVDFRASTYMVTSQLAVHSKLEESLYSSLVGSISKHLGPEMVTEGVSCIAVMCHTQEIKTFTKRTLKYLAKISSLVSVLTKLSCSYYITPLLSCLLLSLLSSHFDNLHGDYTGNHDNDVMLSMIVAVLDAIPLEEETVYEFLRALLQSFIELRSQIGDPVPEDILKSFVAPLLQSMDAKYPKVVDRAIEDMLSASTVTQPQDNAMDVDESHTSTIVTENRAKMIHEFIALSLPQSRHQVLMEASSTVALCVYHHNPSMRAAAVREIGKSLKQLDKKSGSSSVVYSEFLTSSLLARLVDDDPTVVAAVLGIKPKVLFAHLPHSELVPSLVNLLKKKHLHKLTTGWQSCAVRALEILTSQSLIDLAPNHIDDVIAVGIPLLFTGRHSNVFAGRMGEVIGQSALAQVHPVFAELAVVLNGKVWKSGVKESTKDPGILSAACEVMFSCLGQQLAIMETASARGLLSKLLFVLQSTTPDQPSYFVLLSVLGSAVCHMTQEAIGTQLCLAGFLLEHISQNLSTLKDLTKTPGGGDISSLAAALEPLMLKHPNKTLSHTHMLLWVMNTINEHMWIPADLSTTMWLELPTVITTEEHLYYHVLLGLFSLLTHCVEGGSGTVVTAAAKHILQLMTKKHFSKRGTLLRYLAMIWTTPTSSMEPGPVQTSHSIAFPHSYTWFQVSPILQARSLDIASAYLKSLDVQAAMALFGNHCPVVPSLLYPLMNGARAIREAALTCLLSLFESTKSLSTPSEAPPYFHLVSSLCASQLELATDPASLVDLFRRIATDSNEHVTEKKRRQSKKKEKIDEAALKLASVDSVLGHVVMFGMPHHIQLVLLRVLSGFDYEIKLIAVTALLKSLLDRKGDSNLGVHGTPLFQMAVACFTPKMASLFHTHKDAFQMFLTLLKTESVGEASPQQIALSQITPELFVALENQALQQTLLQTLIDILLNCKTPSVSLLTKQQIIKLPLSVEMVHTELTLHSDQLGGDKPPATPSKRARRSKAPPTSTGASSAELTGAYDNKLPWKRVTIILELLQQNLGQVSDCHLLVQDLFNLLNRCLDVDQSQRQQLEYTQQLLLSSLLEMCDQLIRNGVEIARDLLQESQFNVELVVQCVRLSLNPQTHHHALLLLSTAAAIFPDRVLHNIMPIFTFMGANMLRHDDQYSFHVINRTIDTVIPALIQSGPTLFSSSPHSSLPRRSSARVTTPTTVEGVVEEIIHVFVDALPHIPDHRRLPLFSRLLRTVGAEGYLHVVLGLLVEKQVVQGTSKEEVSKEVLVDTSFSLSLAQYYPPNIQLLSMHKVSHCLSRLPQEKPKTASKLHQLPAAASALFNIAAHTEKQLKRFKSSALSLLLSLLTDKEFVSKMSAMDVSGSAEMEGVVLKLLQSMLSYTISLNKSKSCTPAEETKYWQSLLNKAYSVVDKVISLLSPQAFLDIVCQLVAEDSIAKGDIQRKTLDILNSKLEGNKVKFAAEHETTMLELVDLLVGVASNDHTPPVTRQTALYGVKLLTRRLAGKYDQWFIKSSKAVLSIMSNNAELQPQVLSSCLLCVAEMCSSLGPHSIPLLPTVLPQVLSCLGREEERSELLLLSATTTLGVIVKTLPKFLSSFVHDIISKLCHPSLTAGSGQLMEEATSVRQSVSDAVPCRVLLPAYLKCYPSVVHHGNNDCVVALLSMLTTTIDHMDKDEVKVHSSLLLDVFTTTLDYRATQESHLSMVAIETVETQCLKAFSTLVVKLSETLFRPMFIKLLDWATQSSAPKDRLISFYHMADCVAGKLKNLFLLFAGHIVKNVSSLLITIHEEKQKLPYFGTSDEDMEDLDSDQVSPTDKGCLLLEFILQCLSKCFLYDKGGNFLTKERFDTLMQPLVDQVSNMSGGSTRFSQRVESSLVPCLSNFAVAAGKDSLWKPLNYQLLLKTKHSSPQVRFAVLKVLQELYIKLGEEFMVLLPETIPFLAECMEDESAEVEQQSQSVVATIEQILGEPIQQYF